MNGGSHSTKLSGHKHRNVEEHSVLQIARRVAATVGADFFNAIAIHLSKALSADCVLIGEFVGGPMERVKTLGAAMDGKPTSFEFELAGSAAATVAQGKLCMCRSDAASRFPDDELLPIVGAQSLIAEPLNDQNQQPAGLIMVLYRRPMVSFRVVKHVMEIFSARAAAELNRKRREDQLCESEQRHRAFIARSADAMWRIEFERPIATDQPEEEQFAQIYRYGYLAECNDALAHLYGFECADQMLGSRVEDVAPASDPSMRDATLLAIRSGFTYTTVETNVVDRSGIRHNIIRSQWGIVEDGKLERIWGTSRDITQLKRSEQALDASEQRMVDLLETVQLVVIIVEPDGRVAFCNNYMYRKSGWKQADVVGKDWVRTLVPTDEHSKLRDLFAACSAKTESPTHFECTFLGAYGQHWQFEWDRTSLRDPEGHIVAWANVGRDVTDYRALQAQFIQAQKLATIGRLAGGLAHDFNNLLTVIMGYSGVLLRDRPESDPAYLGLTQIRKAAGKGADLTHRLLAFGRRQVLRPEVLNLNVLIADAEHMMRHLVGDDVRVATKLDASLWRVGLDAASFHQILMNLAANARDAMPDGGVITVATANVPVNPATAPGSTLPPGDYVRISVSDTGTGLSEAARRHLFEPFFTTKEKGTGLGLSTVYGIVQQSGGQIFVDSETHSGTTFRIYFPRAEGPDAADQKTPVPAVAEHGSETILVAEDRDDVRQLVSHTLRTLGYTVLEANGPTTALELAQDRGHVIHLLLTDLAMPDMNGFELAEHVNAYCEGIKVVFMSGFADTPQITAEVSQPGRAYLQKPFTPDDLGAAVRKVLDEN
jgi:PAS domain S-box-containing protein